MRAQATAAARLVVALVIATSLAVALGACAPASARHQPVAGPTGTFRVDNSAFALDLYHRLDRRPGNLAYSPYSVSSALAMTYAGARGATATEMARALHFRLPREALHSAFGSLRKDLATRTRGGAILDVANSLWGDRGTAFEHPFLDTLGQRYGAPLRQVDYRHAPRPARAVINSWVSRHTHGKISDLLPRDVIDELTRLVLVNTVYLKARWSVPFVPDPSRMSFHTPDGVVKAHRMVQKATLPYARGNDVQAVELPYRGGRLAMDVIVPDAPHFSGFERGLTGPKLDRIVAGFRSQTVNLSMPRYTVARSFDLSSALTGLGMGTAFTDQADFTGMSRSEALDLRAVEHQAVVRVAEKGTEAAAATAIVVQTVAGEYPPPVYLNVDRPFLFVIRDRPTGTILFIGRVIDPTARS